MTMCQDEDLQPSDEPMLPHSTLFSTEKRIRAEKAQTQIPGICSDSRVVMPKITYTVGRGDGRDDYLNETMALGRADPQSVDHVTRKASS
jgi:hypothetical protein